MRDRNVDSTPIYRTNDRNSSVNRNQGSQDRRVSYHRVRRESNDRNVVQRIDERIQSNNHGHYSPPRHVGGYYHYNYGWPSRYNYPLRYGFWIFDYDPVVCRRSVYFYYDYFPYIPSTRIIIINRPVVKYVEVPIVIKEKRYYESGYYLEANNSLIERILSDIRRAWVLNEPDLLLQHVWSDVRIDVLMDGEYSYTLEPVDYDEMTRDAIKSTETIDFEFTSVRSRGDDRIVAYGRHKFYDLNDNAKTVYVSYEFVRQRGEWVIDEVGSSAMPLDK
jgi:hypothetical protein